MRSKSPPATLSFLAKQRSHPMRMWSASIMAQVFFRGCSLFLRTMQKTQARLHYDFKIMTQDFINTLDYDSTLNAFNPTTFFPSASTETT